MADKRASKIDIDIEAIKAEFERAPTLQSGLPFSFPGGEEFDSISVKCPRCGEAVGRESARGEMVWIMRSVMSINALSYCSSCNILFRSYFRIKEIEGEVYIEWLKDNSWHRDRVFVKNKSLPILIVEKVKRLFNK